jgi:hypothetical protein
MFYFDPTKAGAAFPPNFVMYGICFLSSSFFSRDVVWSDGQVPVNPRPPLSQLSLRSIIASPLFLELGDQLERLL